MLMKSAGKFTYFTTKRCGNVCPLSRKFKFPSVFLQIVVWLFVVANSESAYLATGGAFTGQDFDGPSGR